MSTPWPCEQEIVVKNTFLQTRSLKASDIYRKSKTVSLAVPIEIGHGPVSADSEMSRSLESSEYIAESKNHNWSLIWIDELSFKDSNDDKKHQLSQLSASGSVKCYKNTDRFLRAFEKKLSIPASSDTIHESPRYIVLTSHSNMDGLMRVIPNADLIGAVVVLRESKETFSHETKIPTLFADDWERALDHVRTIIRRRK